MLHAGVLLASARRRFLGAEDAVAASTAPEKNCDNAVWRFRVVLAFDMQIGLVRVFGLTGSLQS